MPVVVVSVAQARADAGWTADLCPSWRLLEEGRGHTYVTRGDGRPRQLPLVCMQPAGHRGPHTPRQAGAPLTGYNYLAWPAYPLSRPYAAW